MVRCGLDRWHHLNGLENAISGEQYWLSARTSGYGSVLTCLILHRAAVSRLSRIQCSTLLSKLISPSFIIWPTTILVIIGQDAQ